MQFLAFLCALRKRGSSQRHLGQLLHQVHCCMDSRCTRSTVCRTYWMCRTMRCAIDIPGGLLCSLNYVVDQMTTSTPPGAKLTGEREGKMGSPDQTTISPRRVWLSNQLTAATSAGNGNSDVLSMRRRRVRFPFLAFWAGKATSTSTCGLPPPAPWRPYSAQHVWHQNATASPGFQAVRCSRRVSILFGFEWTHRRRFDRGNGVVRHIT